MRAGAVDVLRLLARPGAAVPEVFAPGACVWPSDGIGIVTEHHGRPEVRAVPVRDAGGANPHRGASYAGHLSSRGGRHLGRELCRRGEALFAIDVDPMAFRPDSWTRRPVPAAVKASGNCSTVLSVRLRALLRKNSHTSSTYPGLRFNFDDLGAADVAGRARAYQSLRGAGMDPDQAGRVAGVT